MLGDELIDIGLEELLPGRLAADLAASNGESTLVSTDVKSSNRWIINSRPQSGSDLYPFEGLLRLPHRKSSETYRQDTAIACGVSRSISRVLRLLFTLYAGSQISSEIKVQSELDRAIGN